MSIDCVGYLEEALDMDTRQDVIRRVVRHLKPIANTFDAIAVRGTSGLLIGPSVADKLGKQIIVVRKPNDGTHSCNRIEGRKIGHWHNYLILDDTVSTGLTVKSILTEVSGKCVGIYCYYEARKLPFHFSSQTFYGTGDGFSVPFIVNAKDHPKSNPKCLDEFAKWL